MENRYKKIREDFEFTPNGYKMTTEMLAKIFNEKGYSSLNHSAIRKIETGKRNVSEYELEGYIKVFKTTADYLLNFTNVASADENLLMIGQSTGLSDSSISILKSCSDFQRTFVDKLISSGAINKITEAYIYRNSHFFRKTEIHDELVGKTTLSKDENKNYHFYRSEQLTKEALEILDKDADLFSDINKAHSIEMWKTVVDYTIDVYGYTNAINSLLQSNQKVPAEVINYAKEKKGSD